MDSIEFDAYCENCRSCGCIGCCLYACIFCIDLYEKDMDEGNIELYKLENGRYKFRWVGEDSDES